MRRSTSCTIEELPDVLKRIRIREGLSQEKLGRMCGMSVTAIHYYETGKRGISLASLTDISKALNYKIKIKFEDTNGY